MPSNITHTARHLARAFGPEAGRLVRQWARDTGDRRWLAVAEILERGEVAL